MKIKGIAKQPIVSRPGDGGEGLEEVVGVVDANIPDEGTTKPWIS